MPPEQAAGNLVMFGQVLDLQQQDIVGIRRMFVTILDLAGDRGHQPPGVTVLGVAKDLPDRPLFDNLAPMHDGDPIGHVGGDAKIVGDEHQPHTFLDLEPLEKVEDLGLHRDIQRRRRLVGDEEVRLQGQSHGDHNALTLAAGKLVGVLASTQGRVRNANPPEQLDGPGVRRFGRALIVGAEGLGDLPADTVNGVEMGQRVLKDHGDFTPVDLAALLRRHGQ